MAAASTCATETAEAMNKKAASQHACPFHNISEDRVGACGQDYALWIQHSTPSNALFTGGANILCRGRRTRTESI